MLKFDSKIKRRKSRARNSDPDQVKYRAFLYVDDKLHGSSTHDTKVAAEEWLSDRKAFIRSGVTDTDASAEGATITWKEVVDRYLACDDATYGGKNQTIAHQRAALWWRDRLGEVSNQRTGGTQDRLLARTHVGAIKKVWLDYQQEDCTAYDRGTGGLVSTGRKRTNATCNRHLAVIKRIMKFAAGYTKPGEEDSIPLLARSPINKETIPGLSEAYNQKDRHLTQEQIGRLLTAAFDMTQEAGEWRGLYAFVLGLLHSGARKSEWLTMRWERINWAKRTALLPTTKNGEPRELHLTPDVVAALEDMTGGVHYLNGFVFPRSNDPGQVHDIRKAIVRLKKRAGLDVPRGEPGYFRLHDLRHCAATVLLGDGHTLPEIGAYLGHKSQQSTKRYAHLEQTKRQAMGDNSFSGMGARRGN